MITFGHLGRYGRLGNQLFQYAALKALGLKNGYEVKIPHLPRASWHGQGCLLNNFNLEAEYLTRDDILKIDYSYSEPDYNQFDESFFDVKDNSTIHGFFQFLDYFEEFEDQLRKEFTPQQIFLDTAQQTLAPLRADGHEVASIHIRRGDMMTHMYDDTGVSPYDVFSQDNIFDPDTIYGRYLSEAMTHFKDRNVKFLVFAGGKRDADDSEDIQYIKKVFDRDGFHISETNDPMLDFVTMMSCDHNITCHQSTFGWWAAFLNPNKDKIVTSPRDYFFLFDKEANAARTANGHFPADWIVV